LPSVHAARCATTIPRFQGLFVKSTF
jgi:hypothetical protein